MFEHVKVHNPQQLFAFKLGAALTMENTVLDMLGRLQEEARAGELKQQLRHHAEETQAQIRNIRHAFDALGREAEEQPCPAIEGIDTEGKSNLAMVEDNLKDHVILAGCSETEHHEISVYENLITHANAMGHDDIVALLVENLEQEQHTLGEVMKAALAQAQRAAATA
jgi:ferritin-like metal-binding protein YciE